MQTGANSGTKEGEELDIQKQGLMAQSAVISIILMAQSAVISIILIVLKFNWWVTY